MRTYYHVTIYLVFPFFFIFSFSSKSSFAIFKQRKVYYEKHKVHFLLLKSSIFACIPWPIGYLWPEESFPSWHLTQGSKQSFWNSFNKLQVASFCWKIPVIKRYWYFSRKKNTMTKVPTLLQRIWREQWDQSGADSCVGRKSSTVMVFGAFPLKLTL